jgi:hypothetical protein
MPVRYGVVCDRCRTLLLIPEERKSGRRIHYDRKQGGFSAKCIPPCPNIISFHTGMLMSYMVTDEAVQCGYADLDDCRPVVKSPGASEGQ